MKYPTIKELARKLAEVKREAPQSTYVHVMVDKSGFSVQPSALRDLLDAPPKKELLKVVGEISSKTNTEQLARELVAELKEQGVLDSVDVDLNDPTILNLDPDCMCMMLPKEKRPCLVCEAVQARSSKEGDE